MHYPRIYELRIRKNLSKKDVAAMLGISVRAYAGYEAGKHRIPLKIIIMLADFYNTSTDYIFGLTDEPNRH